MQTSKKEPSERAMDFSLHLGLYFEDQTEVPVFIDDLKELLTSYENAWVAMRNLHQESLGALHVQPNEESCAEFAKSLIGFDSLHSEATIFQLVQDALLEPVEDRDHEMTLRLMFDRFAAASGDLSRMSRIASLKSFLLIKRFDAPGPCLGTSLGLPDLERIMEESSLEEERKEASNSFCVLLDSMGQLELELRKEQHDQALELGYSGAFSLHLNELGFESSAIALLLQRVEEKLLPLLEEEAQVFGTDLSSRFKRSVAHLEPYHWDDLTMKEAPLPFIQALSLHLSQREADGSAEDLADFLGFDLPPACLPAARLPKDAPGLKPLVLDLEHNGKAHPRVFHRKGLPAQTQSLTLLAQILPVVFADLELPPLLRGPAHPVLLTALESLFEDTLWNPVYLKRFLSLPESWFLEQDSILKASFRRSKVFSLYEAFVQTMFDLECESCSIDAAFEKRTERLKLIPGRVGSEWTSRTHAGWMALDRRDEIDGRGGILSFMGQLVAAQMNTGLGEKGLMQGSEAGGHLLDHYLMSGRREELEELLFEATGRGFSHVSWFQNLL